MSTKVAAEQLIETASKQEKPIFGPDTKCMGLARIGTETQLIVSGPLSAFANEIDMGEPLHSLVLCGEMHEIEEQMYEHFCLQKFNEKMLKPNSEGQLF